MRQAPIDCSTSDRFTPQFRAGVGSSSNKVAAIREDQNDRMSAFVLDPIIITMSYVFVPCLAAACGFFQFLAYMAVNGSAGCL